MLGTPVPRHVGQDFCHAAESANAGKDQSSANEGRKCVEWARNKCAKRNAHQHKATGRNLHLTLKLDGLALVLDNRQPRLLPGIETTFENIGLDLYSLRKLLAGRGGTATGAAMENDRGRITGVDRP